MRSLLKQNSGQAIVEYMLMLSAVLVVVASLSFGFRQIRMFLAMKISCEVIAPCPGCPVPNDRVRNIASDRSGVAGICNTQR